MFFKYNVVFERLFLAVFGLVGPGGTWPGLLWAWLVGPCGTWWGLVGPGWVWLAWQTSSPWSLLTYYSLIVPPHKL